MVLFLIIFCFNVSCTIVFRVGQTLSVINPLKELFLDAFTLVLLRMYWGLYLETGGDNKSLVLIP